VVALGFFFRGGNPPFRIKNGGYFQKKEGSRPKQRGIFYFGGGFSRPAPFLRPLVMTYMTKQKNAIAN